MTQSAVATLTTVSHRYGKRLALDDVRLSIPAGCVAGLIGPDGVGKSTLLGLVSGVRGLQQGQLHVLGADMTNPRVRKANAPRIAYMPQGLGKNLYPTLSVRENLDFFGRMFDQPARERQIRIHELLEATGLAEFSGRPVGNLSGGMKQKLGLCCALIHDPDLLILDEPTTGVDPLSRRQFWQLISAIRQRRSGMSVLAATAYMEEAEQFDWLAAMDDGQVIASGTPAELLAISNTKALDDAFVALLPEEKRAGHSTVAVPPLTGSPVKGPAIEARGLTRKFGDFVAVDNVSFEIARGEIFGFLGSNGSGKTTTMKMLTGLLTPSAGWTKLFGQQMDANDMEMRRRVGYMSQNFSLYTELTARQNLELHARLFHVPAEQIKARVSEMLIRFDLSEEADRSPVGFPLGVRQRLQLAVAVVHRPDVLILDEPTTGVDPIARDAFWQALIDLSRNDGVTIFISTHFMNEAVRCDRISLMHAGKVLAEGPPEDLTREKCAATLEEAFISHLREANGDLDVSLEREVPLTHQEEKFNRAPTARSLRRVWAYALRETKELLRDRIRLFFALVGPLILMLTVGYGISFDVEGISFAVFDQDQTSDSRLLAEQFSSVRFFDEQSDIQSAAELERRFKSGELTVAIEVPSGFGRDINAGLQPELSVWISGSMPFRAETARNYIAGIAQVFGDTYAKELGLGAPMPFEIETRFLFNQAFKSVNVFVPSIIMLILLLIPAVNSTIGVVREKETGSIVNFRATPSTRFEFLVGKQLPYIGVALLSAVMLFLLGVFLFHVPFKGSLFAFCAGTAIYVTATTGFGLVFSCLTKTQVSAIFATTIFSIIPAINFSGLIVPLSSLDGVARVVGMAFPPAWYQPIAMGSFTKGHGFGELWLNIVVLALFYIGFLILSILLLRKQEA